MLLLQSSANSTQFSSNEATSMPPIWKLIGNPYLNTIPEKQVKKDDIETQRFFILTPREGPMDGIQRICELEFLKLNDITYFH